MNTPTTAVVTGASRGLGLAIAEHFATRGARVLACSSRPADPPFTIPGITHCVADVACEEDVKRLFARLRADYGGLDILVNNAGIAALNHCLLTPTAQVERILATNVAGTFLLAREAAKLMRRKRWGRIVNLTSVAVPLRLAGEAVYAASKAAVESLTRVLAHELGEFGITVNAVGPAPTRTDMLAGVPEETLQRLIARQAIKRFGEFRDVLNVIDFFIAPASDFISGQVIYLGGVS